ncbi:unnamed protein product [Periconia digitata]|uniref:Uncharacterized protein n=1 Tax=Periconia digitata TaxID=1303443 RepID=A0A9W4UIR6_9PLEO|nr:unnamed protein product [Periconia digitata]
MTSSYTRAAPHSISITPPSTHLDHDHILHPESIAPKKRCTQRKPLHVPHGKTSFLAASQKRACPSPALSIESRIRPQHRRVSNWNRLDTDQGNKKAEQ